MANRYTRKRDICPGCGREYPAFYSRCPYCEAQWQSMQIARKKWVRPLGETLLALLLGLAVLGGAAYLTARAFAIDTLIIQREYEVVSEDTSVDIAVNVTEQSADLSDSDTAAPLQE